ncbi:MAG: aldehyde dehydrogenase family protein [Candidatus Methanomethylophilaceae archaeon]|nr:aldehyde dehydrogenase family protein [Candidatus Methanomethylophilaceae archaeon]
MSRLQSVNPADLSISGDVEIVDPSEIPGIVEGCRSAQMIWKALPKRRKADLMDSLLDLISDRSDEIAATVHKDTGKPRSECYSTEILTAMATTRYAKDLIRKFRFREKVDQGPMSLMCRFMGRRSYIEYQPYGVIAVISSYNFPIAIPFTETVMAVAAGNAVLIKPSSDTPLCGELIQRLFEDAGFPKGLVRTVSGPGLGSAITSSDVDKIAFTGGTDTGMEVMRSASSKLIPVILELGGKDAMIVMDDADISRAVNGAAWACFVNSGQVCVSVKRIYIQRSVYDRFRDMFVNKVRSLKQGNGWSDDEVSVGPMINGRELERMSSICDRIREQGGRIVLGGRVNPDLEGYYFEPTVVTDLPTDAPVVSEEIFGPIVCLFPFDTEDEAIGLANDNPFALGGSVWTSDLERGGRMASMMRSGTVDVNNALYTYGLPATPWGGRGMSGIGTTHAVEGFRQMMCPHHVHIDKGRSRRDPWWMPYSKEDTDLLKDIGGAFFAGRGGILSCARRFLSTRKRE